MEKEKLNQKPEEILSSINRKMNVLISILMLSDNDRNWGKEIDKIQKLKEWDLRILKLQS